MVYEGIDPVEKVIEELELAQFDHDELVDNIEFPKNHPINEYVLFDKFGAYKEKQRNATAYTKDSENKGVSVADKGTNQEDKNMLAMAMKFSSFDIFNIVDGKRHIPGFTGKTSEDVKSLL